MPPFHACVQTDEKSCEGAVDLGVRLAKADELSGLSSDVLGEEVVGLDERA